ncbi:MAG: hypothetical protein CMI54_04710 [Parcubacteria group bacterium]|nr:hypothetical protein [Parcubacteria group bacterium]|tara:strand:+ start:681 stop:860 length:180 start_codon:yes stop_codon:yes gene_type:complete
MSNTDMSEECEYEHCQNKAAYIDYTDSLVCAECMNREVLEYKLATFDEYESLPNPSIGE